MQAVTDLTRPAIFPITGIGRNLMPMMSERKPKKEEDEVGDFGVEFAASIILPGSEILFEVQDAIDEASVKDHRTISFDQMKEQVAQRFWQRRQSQLKVSSSEQFHPAKR